MRTGVAMLAAAVVLAGAALAGAAPGTVKGTVTSGGESPGPVADAVVLLEGPSVPATAATPHAVMNQRGQRFVPRVLVVATGTTVDFPNGDPVLHNVNAAFAAEPFDLGLYGQGETKGVTMHAPGVRHVRCNVHPSMEGWLVVHTNPWAAVTDAQGRYTIAGVPAGTYMARIWHESLPERKLPITVRDAEVVPLDVRLEP